MLASILAVLAEVVVLAGARAASTASYSFIRLAGDSLAQSLGPNAVAALDFAAIDEITHYLVMTTTSQSGGSSASMANYATLHYRDGPCKRWRRLQSAMLTVGE
jgi:hypothetical protein